MKLVLLATFARIRSGTDTPMDLSLFSSKGEVERVTTPVVPMDLSIDPRGEAVTCVRRRGEPSLLSIVIYEEREEQNDGLVI